MFQNLLLIMIWRRKLSEFIRKNDIEVHPDHIEACHWIKSNAGPKKVIIKVSRRKDADKIRREKKKLKGLDSSSIGINLAVFINDSLCRYCKETLGKM